VIGGGNNICGGRAAKGGLVKKTRGDHLGVLATVIKAIAIQEALGSSGPGVRGQSALQVEAFCGNYIMRRAPRHLEKGRVVVFA
ncbi:UMP kinase, partial [Campylobacter jejuni]